MSVVRASQEPTVQSILNTAQVAFLTLSKTEFGGDVHVEFVDADFDPQCLIYHEEGGFLDELNEALFDFGWSPVGLRVVPYAEATVIPFAGAVALPYPSEAPYLMVVAMGEA